MMGWGTMGSGAGGYSSSSTSNLSALAPPFTVDRLNPKSSTNPLLHYSDSPYVDEPFSRPWPYAHPSAPSSEMVIDSAGINNVPVSDDYRFSASASFSPSSTQWSAISSSTKAMASAFVYDSEVKPYHPTYVPPLVGGDSLLVENEGARYNVVSTSGLNGTSLLDYTQSLFDSEYGPRWVDSLRFDDGKRANISEFDGSFASEKANIGGSHSYVNRLYQGWHSSENRNQPKEDSVVSYQSLNQVCDRENRFGSSSIDHIEDKSCLEQNPGFFPYNSHTTFVATSSFSYPESYPSVVTCEMKNIPNYKNPFNAHEKCVRPIDTPFPGRTSVVRASPSVVIRPPPVTNGNSGKIIAPCKLACSENVGSAHSVDLGCTNPLKLKDSCLPSSSKTNKTSVENLFNFSEQGNGLISSLSVTELSSPLQSSDASDRNVKARFGSRLSDINVSSGISVTGDKNSFDNIDPQNTAVDSPCWKGAPSSQFSTFDIEAGNSNPGKVNLDGRYGFRLEEHKNLHSMVDSDRVFSDKVEEIRGKENECTINGVALNLERTFNAICSTKERSLLDVGTRDTLWTSPMTRSKGVELTNGTNMLNKEPNLLNNLTSVFDIKVSDPKHSMAEEVGVMTVNEVSEGAAIAVHAAEKVLDSPASQEDATEHNIVSLPKLDVQAMIKAIHNLSEVLQFHLSIDACSLEEENTETLKHVINNINTCLSKKVVQSTRKTEPNSNPVGDTTQILGESCDVGTPSGGPQMESVCEDSHIKFDHLDTHEERNYSFPGKKDEKSLSSPSLRDELDITGNDDMTKAIKKVLDENFQLNEEMHSQALLFKNLWLEAEAKLCSISYKARFDRMKIKMEEFKRRAPKGNEDIPEMMPQFFISPDPITTSELSHNAGDPTLQNTSIPSTSGKIDDVEASVLARFNILKCREDTKPMNMEEQQQPDIVDGDDAASKSVEARYNILKSREGNSDSISMNEEKQPKMIDSDADSMSRGFNVERIPTRIRTRILSRIQCREDMKLMNMEEQQPDIVDGDDAASKSIEARYNILKSREGNSDSICMNEEKQPKMIDSDADPIMARLKILKLRNNNSELVGEEDEQPPKAMDGEFSGEKYLRPYMRGQLDDETVIVAQQPRFVLPQTGILTDGKFDSYGEVIRYESLNEYHPSVINDPIILPCKSNENSSGSRDSSSSDWEHVLKEDFHGRTL